MQYTDDYGLSIPEFGWVPAPRYILRRLLILEEMKKVSKGTVLEIGIGAGTLLYDLYKLGFEGIGLETSEEARKIALKIFENIDEFKIEKNIEFIKKETFNYLLSFEVLEHIENDLETLKEWNKLLKPKGKILLSVPAHMKKWTDADICYGHYRRYEKMELLNKFKDAGFKVEKIFCYGFPLNNLIEPIRIMVDTIRRDKSESQTENTGKSGIERSVESRIFPFYNNFLGKLFFKFFHILQKLFLRFDLGNGYLVLAEKEK